jgi:catechol 2,3-dioxygenase-like lactoylglutathione lyase family enzyme
MQIKFASVMVDDQARALKFYTDVLGFVKHADISFGAFRWLTVIAPQGVVGAELVLESMGFPPSKACQKALFDAGIPAAAFTTTNIQGDFGRLGKRGVKFHGEPQVMGPIAAVRFEDNCGNLIDLVQPLD